MLNYFAGSKLNSGVRQHPWTVDVHNPEWKYHDFKVAPELIPAVLDDFKPWEHHEAIKQAYEIIRWLNSDESNLETNDSRFRGPTKNQQRDQWDKELLFHGGLMVLFRNLSLNLSEESREWVTKRLLGTDHEPDYQPNKYVRWLADRSLQLIDEINQDFKLGCLAVHFFPTFFSDAPVDEPDKFGNQIAFEWWAWGDDPDEALDNFRVVIDTLSKCLRQVSSEVAK